MIKKVIDQIEGLSLHPFGARFFLKHVRLMTLVFKFAAYSFVMLLGSQLPLRIEHAITAIGAATSNDGPVQSRT